MSTISLALRRKISDRASNRCEYCLIPNEETYWDHEVDHIYAEKHGGETVESNLALSCVDCNRNKGSDLCSLDPESGAIERLFHPRLDQWNEHFQLDGSRIMPLTPVGRVTVRLLQLNNQERLFERNIWIALGRYPSS